MKLVAEWFKETWLSCLIFYCFPAMLHWQLSLKLSGYWANVSSSTIREKEAATHTGLPWLVEASDRNAARCKNRTQTELQYFDLSCQPGCEVFWTLWEFTSLKEMGGSGQCYHIIYSTASWAYSIYLYPKCLGFFIQQLWISNCEVLCWSIIPKLYWCLGKGQPCGGRNQKW